MHKLVSNGHFCRGGPPNLRGIKYFDLLFCHNHSLTKRLSLKRGIGESENRRIGNRGTGNRRMRMGNGERGTENEERGTGNGERGTGNGERGTGNGERGTGNL